MCKPGSVSQRAKGSRQDFLVVQCLRIHLPMQVTCIPFLEQEAFGEVDPRQRFYGGMNDSEFAAECGKLGISLFGIVCEVQGWEVPADFDENGRILCARYVDVIEMMLKEEGEQAEEVEQEGRWGREWVAVGRER